MSRIVISLSGEGRGHAARTLTLLEMLADKHCCLVLAPRSILPWLRSAAVAYETTSFCLLPSLRFQYDHRGNLSYWRSWMRAIPFLSRLQSHLAAVRVAVDAFQPDLAIADFEPLLPRVARLLNIPLLSLDHQHFLYSIDTRELPRRLQSKVRFLRPSIKLICPSADRHLVSSFYRYPQLPNTESYQQVGTLIRKAFWTMEFKTGEYVLAYVRRPQSATWLSELQHCGVPCRVYGGDWEGCSGNLEFRKIDTRQFMRDLAGCRALITTAGNQLVGEALAARKPVLAVPEPGNFEQELNSYFLSASGMGRSLFAEECTAESIRVFLDSADVFRVRTAAYDAIGNGQVLQEIGQLISPGSSIAYTGQLNSLAAHSEAMS